MRCRFSPTADVPLDTSGAAMGTNPDSCIAATSVTGCNHVVSAYLRVAGDSKGGRFRPCRSIRAAEQRRSSGADCLFDPTVCSETAGRASSPPPRFRYFCSTPSTSMFRKSAACLLPAVSHHSLMVVQVLSAAPLLGYCTIKKRLGTAAAVLALALS
jgi:hypothetical protein